MKLNIFHQNWFFMHSKLYTFPTGFLGRDVTSGLRQYCSHICALTIKKGILWFWFLSSQRIQWIWELNVAYQQRKTTTGEQCCNKPPQLVASGQNSIFKTEWIDVNIYFPKPYRTNSICWRVKVLSSMKLFSSTVSWQATVTLHLRFLTRALMKATKLSTKLLSSDNPLAAVWINVLAGKSWKRREMTQPNASTCKDVRESPRTKVSGL